MIWHTVTAAQAVEQLQSDVAQGLSASQVSQREAQRETRCLRPFLTPTPYAVTLYRMRRMALLCTVALLIATAVVTWLDVQNGEELSVLACVAVALLLLMNALGWLWVRRRCRLLRAGMEQRAVPQARVLREGKEQLCRADRLVVGDILLIGAGELICADARLTESNDLWCDQGALSGEYYPVYKQADAVLRNITPLIQRSNMVYAGCAAVRGNGVAVVTEVGKDTQLFSLPKQPQHLSESRQQWQSVLRLLLPAAAVGAVLLFLVGWLSGNGLLFAALSALSFFVGCFGVSWEALYHTVYTVGAHRLCERGVLLCRETAAEKLPDISVIMTDKTGVLTDEKMELITFTVGDRRFNSGDAEPQSGQLLLRLATLCCTGQVQIGAGGQTVQADATESAILEAALQRRMYSDVLQTEYPRLQYLPFTSQRCRMSSLHMIEGRYVLIVKGTPESVFPLCTAGVTDAVCTHKEQLRGEGLRVIAVAYRFFDGEPSVLTEEDECDFSLVGLLGLRDVPQNKVMETVERCLKNGITPLVCTADHPQAAEQMARRLGLLQHSEQGITDEQIHGLSDEQLVQRARDIRLYCGSDTAARRRLLEALRQNGVSVAAIGLRDRDTVWTAQADVRFTLLENDTKPMFGTVDVLLEREALSAPVGALGAGRSMYRRLWKGTLFALLAQAAALLSGLLLYLIDAETVWQPWQWLCIGWLEIPLLSLLLASGGSHRFLPKSKATVRVLVTAALPLFLCLIGTALPFAWGAFAAFAVGTVIQTLLLMQ